MQVVRFDDKLGLIAETQDLQVEAQIDKPIDVILIAKEHMLNFRETPLFQSLWKNNITNKTRFVYV